MAGDDRIILAYRAATGRGRRLVWPRLVTDAELVWLAVAQVLLSYDDERHWSESRSRIVQRLLALNAVIWHNWNIGAPVTRSLVAYDH